MRWTRTFCYIIKIIFSVVDVCFAEVHDAAAYLYDAICVLEKLESLSKSTSDPWSKIPDVNITGSACVSCYDSIARSASAGVTRLSVCLSICPLCSWRAKLDRTTSPKRRWKWDMALISLYRGRRKVCSCAPAFKLVSMSLGGAITGYQTWKRGKIGGFHFSRATE